MSTMKQKLKDAKKRWAGARKRAEEESGFTEFEDGQYITKLTGATLGESKSSGRLQIVWEHTFLDGEYEGKKKLDFDGLETEDNLMWLARKLARLGYEVPEDFDDIPGMLEEIVAEGIEIRISLKTKGEYQNLRIERVLSDDTDDEEEEEDDDEIEEEDDDEEEEEEEDDED